MRTRRIIHVLAAALVALALGPFAQAFAAPPDMQRIQIDSTHPARLLSQECGFTIMRQDEGTLTIHSFYDGTGNLMREIDALHTTNTFTANGHSLTGISRTIDHYIFNSDGSATVRSPGPSLWTTDRGQGPIWGTTGLWIYEISADGESVVVSTTGENFTADASAVCAALAP